MLGLRLAHAREEVVEAVVLVGANDWVVVQLVKYLVLVQLLWVVLVLVLFLYRLRDVGHRIVPRFLNPADLLFNLTLPCLRVPLLLILNACQVERHHVSTPVWQAHKAVTGNDVTGMLAATQFAVLCALSSLVELKALRALMLLTLAMPIKVVPEILLEGFFVPA